MMTAAKIGCRSHGIEVIPNRYLAGVEFMKARLQDGSLPKHFGHLVSFANLNAAEQKGAFIVDGLHATHIFINNYRFSATNNKELAKRLNVTAFKMLVWCCTEK